MTTAPKRLEATIVAYNEAWNAHDVERIGSLHAPDMVFENHTAGERAEGERGARAHRGASSSRGPTSRSRRAGSTCARTSSCRSGPRRATHVKPLRRGDIVAEPSGQADRVEGHGRDPVRGRQDQAQGRLLGLRVDPAPGRAAVAGAGGASASPVGPAIQAPSAQVLAAPVPPSPTLLGRAQPGTWGRERAQVRLHPQVPLGGLAIRVIVSRKLLRKANAGS